MKVLAVTNMYPTDERPYQGTFVEQQVKGLRMVGVEVDVLLFARQERGVLTYASCPGRLCQALKTGRADVVHVMYGGVMALAVSGCVGRVPLVVSFCGDDLLGTIGRWPMASIRSWTNKRASLMAARRAAAVVVKSRNLAKALPEEVNSKRVYVVPNGVDLERFKPLDREACRQALNWSDDSFQVVFGVNGDPQTKRLALAQEAVARLNALGARAVLRLLDRVPHRQVPVWLNAGDVLLLTSIHEGSVNLVKEALACNLPVVSVDVGDVAERIQGVNMCHISAADPLKLAERMKDLALAKSRSNGRVAVAELSLEAIARKLHAIYASLDALSGSQPMWRHSSGRRG
ncbi:MAG: glycosyltransferase [Acidobacteria bacterium]|nr:glycosyltransferase [Acidobacteriota bacterium]